LFWHVFDLPFALRTDCLPVRFSYCSLSLGTSSKVVRKSIARVLTVINQNKKQAVREQFADKV
jgi:hypothetical protein